MSSEPENIRSSSSAAESVVSVGYVSDVEGNYDYWCRYVQMSRILCRNPEGKIELKDQCHLVYGGDVVDRGPGDIRVLSDLVDLKKAYPERVHFILGNRDINKMRIPVELSPVSLTTPARVYWVKETGEVEDEFPSERLKWMLSKTMGSPMAFEYRREELKFLGCNSTDADVAASYLELMKPQGLLTKYLECGKIAVILGDTLFIHGAIHPYNLGWLPPSRKMMTQAKDGTLHVQSPETLLGHKFEGSLREWVDLINQFAYEEARDFMENLASFIEKYEESCSTDGCPAWPISWASVGGYNHPQPGSRLLQYGMGWLPDKTLNPSTVYSNYLMAQGSNGESISEPSVEVAAYLKMSGIRKVIVGHQPRGDAPLILDLNTGIQIISADTSYAANTLWDNDNTGDWTSLPHRPNSTASRSACTSPKIQDATGNTANTTTTSMTSSAPTIAAQSMIDINSTAAASSITKRGPSASYKDLLAAAAVMHHASSGSSSGSVYTSPRGSFHADDHNPTVVNVSSTIHLNQATTATAAGGTAGAALTASSRHTASVSRTHVHSKDDTDPSVQRKKNHWPQDLVKRVVQLSRGSGPAAGEGSAAAGSSKLCSASPPSASPQTFSRTNSHSNSPSPITTSQVSRRNSGIEKRSLSSPNLIADVTSSQAPRALPAGAWKLGMPQKENSRGIAVAEIILHIPQEKLHMVGGGANIADTELLNEWRTKNISVHPHQLLDPRSRRSLSVCASSEMVSAHRLSIGSDSSAKQRQEAQALLLNDACLAPEINSSNSSLSDKSSNSNGGSPFPGTPTKKRRSGTGKTTTGSGEGATSPFLQYISDTIGSLLGSIPNLGSTPADGSTDHNDEDHPVAFQRPGMRRTVTPPPERGHVPHSAFQSLATSASEEESSAKHSSSEVRKNEHSSSSSPPSQTSPDLKASSSSSSSATSSSSSVNGRGEYGRDSEYSAVPPPVSKVFITGVLSEGTEYSFELPPTEDNMYIGKKTSDGWYVKAAGIRPYEDSSGVDEFGDIEQFDSYDEDASDDETGTQTTEVHTHTGNTRSCEHSTASEATDDLDGQFPFSPNSSNPEFRSVAIKSMLEDSDGEDHLNNHHDRGYGYGHYGNNNSSSSSSSSSTGPRMTKQRSNSSDAATVVPSVSMPSSSTGGSSPLVSVSAPSSSSAPTSSAHSPHTSGGSRSTSHTTTTVGVDTSSDSRPSSEKSGRSSAGATGASSQGTADRGHLSSAIKKMRSRDRDKDREREREREKDRDGLQCKRRRASPPLYLMSHATGFTVKNKIVTEDELRKLLNLDPNSSREASEQLSQSQSQLPPLDSPSKVAKKA